MLLCLDSLIFAKLKCGYGWCFIFIKKGQELDSFSFSKNDTLVFLQFENIRAFLHHRIKRVLAAGEMDHQQARR